MESSDTLIVPSTKRLKSMQIFSVAATALLSLFTTVMCIGALMRYEVDTDVVNIYSVSYWKDELPPEQHVWYEEGIAELEYALNLDQPMQAARNVIIFMVHGISPAALAATRYAKGQPTAALLSWDKFPHVGRLKNSCSNVDVCDLYTVATGLLGGVKTTFGLGGLDAAVEYRNCSAAANERHRIASVFEHARDVGLRRGVVTRRRLTGPVAAALYAHTPDTAWQCDAAMPVGAVAAGCLDVAQQLLAAELNVMLGGGRQTLVSNVPTTAWDPIDETICNSKDGRNLVRDWQRQKLLRRQRFTTLQNGEELRKLNGSAVEYALGVFANGDLSNDNAHNSTPTLEQMLNKAMAVLQRDETGYLLLVENGVESDSSVQQQVAALLELDAIISRNAKLNSTNVQDDTLFLLAFPRGNYVRYSVDSSAETEAVQNLYDGVENDQLLDERFRNILTDTVIYANGPQSYLFHGIHEEVYMAHVISYALKMGPYRKQADLSTTT